MTALELKYSCDEHSQKQCWVMRNGVHRQLTKANLALWALMIVRLPHFCCILITYSKTPLHIQQQKQTDLETPPWNLKLEDAPPRSRTKTNMTAKEIPPHPDYPSSHLPAPGTPSPLHFMPHGPYSYPGSFPYSPYYLQGFRPTEQPPIEDLVVDDPTLFPFISDWLLGLNQGQRRTDGHDFAQYIQNFSDNKIRRIFEIADSTLFTRDNILVICPGMKIGTANLLLKYAREDVEVIRNEEQL